MLRLSSIPRALSLASIEKPRPFVPGGEIYTPGTEPAVFSWNGANVAPFVCYDLRFPELFREAARRWQPEILVVIASWPEARVSHWLALLQARAIENQAFVIGVNRTGTDPYFRYPGRSVVYEYSGACLADAGEGEGVTRATLDLSTLREYRARLPFLKDLR
ncbi:MAG: nitrilase-related carbon-nitrogen hydrolase [Armatimonas sp.]